MKIRIWILLLIWYPMIGLNAQFNITGSVVNKLTEEKITDAEVYLVELDQIQNGRFRFIDLSKQSYTIIVFSIGYQTEEHIIDLQSDTTLTFTLDHLAEEMSEVVIRDQRDELFALRRLRAVEGTSIFAGKKTEVVRLDKVLGNVATNNSRQVYAQVAGLNIYEGNDGGLQLGIGGRGLDPNRTSNFNTRQNGYDISADVLGYPESYYTPPVQALDEIQVIRGAASLQYGTQFGGLINFKTHRIPSNKKFELKTSQTVGSFNFFNSFNSLGLRRKKFSFNAFYNYKQGDGYRSNSSFKANNLFTSLQYDFTPKSSIKFEYTYFQYLAQQAGGLTDTQFQENPRLSTRTRNWFRVDWNLFNLLFRQKFGSRSEMTINVFALDASRSSLGFRGNPSDLNSNPIIALDERDASGSFINPRDLIIGAFNNSGAEARFLTRYFLKGKRAVWLVGSKYYRAINESFQGPGSLGSDPDFTPRFSEFPDYPNQSEFLFPNRNLALFTENIFYLNDRWSLTPGMRIEHIVTSSAGTYNNVVFDNAGNPISNKKLSDNRSLPRTFALFGLGVNYQKSEDISFFANLSQNYRSVTFSDIRTVNPTFIIDPEITDESGFTTDFGMRGRWKESLSFDIGAFSVVYNDRIGIILDNRANRVRKNVGDAVIYGFESLLDWNLTPDKKQIDLSVFSNLAITDSRYIRSEENNVVGNRVEFIPLANWKTGMQAGYRDFLASFQFTYLSRQFTDVQNSSRPDEGSAREGIIGPIPAYSIMDLSLSYKWRSLTLDGGINNVANTAYFTRRATGYPGPGIIPSDGRSYYLTISYKI